VSQKWGDGAPVVVKRGQGLSEYFSRLLDKRLSLWYRVSERLDLYQALHQLIRPSIIIQCHVTGERSAMPATWDLWFVDMGVRDNMSSLSWKVLMGRSRSSWFSQVRGRWFRDWKRWAWLRIRRRQHLESRGVDAGVRTHDLCEPENVLMIQKPRRRGLLPWFELVAELVVFEEQEGDL
jgi:hypothetical protein